MTSLFPIHVIVVLINVSKDEGLDLVLFASPV